MKKIGYINLDFLNKEDGIIILFEVNGSTIGIEYYLEGNKYIPKFSSVNNIIFPELLLEDKNKLNYYFNGEKTLDNFKINKVNNEFIGISIKNGHKNMFKIYSNKEINLTELKQQLINKKSEIFLINYVKINNDSIDIKNKLIDMKKYFSELNERQYSVSFDMILNIAKQNNIIVYYTNKDFSYQEIDNDLMPCIYISNKTEKSRHIFILGYFLLNYFKNKQTTLAVSNQVCLWTPF